MTVRLSLVKKLFPNIIEQIYGAPNLALKNVTKLKIEEFKKWITSANNYRHGQATETIDEPPLTLAILIISTGVAYLRWLAELDSLTQGIDT